MGIRTLHHDAASRGGFWSRMHWTCIMDVEPLKWSWLTKISKKIPITGARTLSVDRNGGKLPANGSKTCASHWERRCKEARYANSSGPSQRNAAPVPGFRTPPRRVWPLAIGRRCQASTWSNCWGLLYGKRTGKATLSHRGQSVVE